MAKIALNLDQFKASGVYTLEYDASEQIIINTQTIRLIIGFSRKGIFNAPVYLPDAKTAKTVFGDIDTYLEKQGSFFHRMIYTALTVGPVYALNLLPLNNHSDLGDKVPYQSFSLSTTEINGNKIYKLYSSFFNKERFWFPDQEYFLANVNSPGSVNSGKLLNVVNLGQKPVSVLIRKARPKEFNVTAVEWYGIGNVPPYIYDDDYLSDYFIQVLAVEGDWTDYKRLSEDPIFSEYFTREGLKKGKMREFLSAPEVTTIAETIGTIIPDFVDKREVNYSIDTLMNQKFASTGLFIAIDRNALDEYTAFNNESDSDNYSAIDLIGHNIAKGAEFDDVNGRTNPEIMDFISYRTGIDTSYVFDFAASMTQDTFDSVSYNLGGSDKWYWESQHLGGEYGYYYNTIVVKKPATEYQDSLDLIEYYKLKNLLVPEKSLIKYAVEEYSENGFPTAYHYGLVKRVYEVEENFGMVLKIVFSNKHKSNDILKDVNNNQIKFAIQAIQDDTGSTDYARIKVDATSVSESDRAEYDNYVPTDNVLIKNPVDGEFYYLSFVDYNGETLGGVADIVNGTSINLYVKKDNNYNKLVSSISTMLNSNSVEQDKIETGDDFAQALKIYAYPYKGTSTWLVNRLNLPGTVEDMSNDIEFFAKPDRVYLYTPGQNEEQLPTISAIRSDTGSRLYNFWDLGIIQDGDLLKVKLGEGNIKSKYLEFDQVMDPDSGAVLLQVKLWDSYTQAYDAYGNLVSGKFAVIDDDADTFSDIQWDTYIVNQIDSNTSFEIFTDFGDAKKQVPIINSSLNALRTEFAITRMNKDLIEVGDYMVGYKVDRNGVKDFRLTKVISKIKRYDSGLNDNVFVYKTLLPIYLDANSIATRIKDIEDYIDDYKLFHLEGFKMTEWHMPSKKNKLAQLVKILGVLDEANSNLTKILKDRDKIQFRYLIDSFDGSINPNTYPKTYLTQLAMKRQKCLAIMNAPAIQEFINSVDPRFTEEPTLEDPKPIFNSRYIPDGGNLSLGPAFTFTLPDEANGSKFAGYFTPNLVLREKGKNISVPPAAHVSNNFVQKFINGTPFHLVAGTKRGIISDPKLVGLEYDFLLEDREYLQPFGLNPIIYKKNKGCVIYGNNLAYQKTKSAFNNLHVRDLLITVEEAIEDILQSYLFDFNEDTIRLEIKTRVEKYLEGVRTAGGIYNYEVTMDESNNTTETIADRVGIIDVSISPTMGLEKIVNRITVTRSDGVKAEGFSF